MSGYDPMAHGARCDLCPLRGQHFVAPAGPLDASFVIIGDVPSQTDMKFGRPFIGPAGAMLDDLFWFVAKQTQGALKRNLAWLTYGLLCRPEVPDKEGQQRYDLNAYVAWLRRDNRRLKKLGEPQRVSPFECCAPRLYAEIDRCDAAARSRGAPNGAIVYPLENYALATVRGKPGKSLSTMKHRGSVLVYGELT